MKYFIRAITTKYTAFYGRARRKEFWFFVIFSAMIFAAIWAVSLFIEMTFPKGMVDAHFLAGVISKVIFLLLLIPLLATTARRLHDIGRSGWFQILAFVPIIGWLILLVWLCKDSEWTDNRYGLNPTRTKPKGYRSYY